MMLLNIETAIRRYGAYGLAAFIAAVVGFTVFEGMVGSMADIPWTRMIRVTSLVATTVLVSMLFGVIIRAIWALDDTPDTVRVAPFTVIDPSGNISNAEQGLATLLISRLDDLKADVQRSRDFVKISSENNSFEDPRVPEALLAVIADPARLLVESGADARTLPDLTLQGVDLTGLFAWIRRSLREPERTIAFTVNLDAKEGVSIAGNIADLNLDGATSMFVGPREQSLSVAINDLAYAIYQRSLTQNDPRLSALEQGVFREMIIAVLDFENTKFHQGFSEEERLASAKSALAAISQALKQAPQWSELSFVEGRVARLAGDNVREREAYERAQGAAEVLQATLGTNVKALIGSAKAAVSASAGTRSLSADIRSGPSPDAGIVTRKDVDRLDPGEISRLRDVFAVLEALPADDPDSLASLTAFQADYAAENALSTLFLPWNRAFIAHVEQVMRKVDPEVALPCWPYGENGSGSLPEIYRLPADQKTNPLYRDLRNPEALKGAAPTAYPFSVRSLLAIPDLAEFSSKLENLNGARHVWVGGRGGLMSSIRTAAADPLFYAHRCAIDRIWAEWEAGGGPRGGYTAEFLERMLPPFSMKVRDVLDTRALGYVYDTLPYDPEN